VEVGTEENGYAQIKILAKKIQITDKQKYQVA